MSNDALDKNNIMVIELGPAEIKLTLSQQIGYFRDTEKQQPNCCMLGMAIVSILDGAGMIRSDNGQLYFEDLKVYLDGDNQAAICVGYNPFLNKQKIIL